MKKCFFLCCSLLLCASVNAQLSIGYFPFQSELSLSTHSERILRGEIRLSTNTFFGNITVEPILLGNIKRTEKINYYAGLGMNLNFFNAASNLSIINGYHLHLGARIKPFNDLKKLHLIFEISPYMNRNFDGGILRTRLGIAYQFGK